jgi:hypothetical protein
VARGLVGQGFTKPLGVAATNLKEGGRISGNAAATIDSVSWSIFGGSKYDREFVYTNATWAWEFPQVVFDGSPLDTIKLPGWPQDAEAQKAVLAHYHQRGKLSGHREYPKHPVYLPPNDIFCIRVELSPILAAHTFDGDTCIRFQLGVQYSKEICVA